MRMYQGGRIEALGGDIGRARSLLVSAVHHCPPNLLWRVWLGSARLEALYGSAETAGKLLRRALDEVGRAA